MPSSLKYRIHVRSRERIENPGLPAAQETASLRSLWHNTAYVV